MALSKYPVISPEGNEYRVDVFKGWVGYHVDVFEPVIRRNILGIKREKFNHVSGGMYDSYYNGHKWEYDFVAMAEHEVRNYEQGLRYRKKEDAKIATQVENFLNWDGNIREGGNADD